MVTAARMAGLAMVLCALTAAPARANFFPDLTVAFDPPTAGGAPALTAAISQPASDSAVERFTVNLPKGFVARGAPGAASCAPAALRAGTCTSASRIGTVDGRVGAAVGLAGSIHKIASGRFVAIVSTLGGAVRQVVPGSLSRRADGSLDLRVDRLPALALTNLTLRFAGGPRALVATPRTCGDHAIAGKFTSRGGDLALDLGSVEIRGCRGVPAVEVANIRLSRARFRAGGSRLGYRTIIAWWASRAADRTDIRIEREVRRRWRVVGRLVTGANAGENLVRWDGRLRDRALRPGSYGVRIRPAGSAPSRIVRFRIV